MTHVGGLFSPEGRKDWLDWDDWPGLPLGMLALEEVVRGGCEEDEKEGMGVGAAALALA